MLMTAPDNLPTSYTTWSNAQLVSWAEGVGSCFLPYLAALRSSNVSGRWLSCLTDSDLLRLGIDDIGDIRNIQAAVSRLIEDYAELGAENMQNLLFSVIHTVSQFGTLLKHVRFNDTSYQAEEELEHHLVKCLLRLGFVAKKAASWLERSPFSHISRLAALRGVILQHVVDLNTVLQSALRKSSLLTYVNAMLDLTKRLRDHLDVVIHDCDDSILLTPCTLEYVTLRKGEKENYGFAFYTNECHVHIIQSLDSDLQAPAFSCGRIARDDEIVEVNSQLVLGWTHTAVARLIQQSSRRLDLRVRKRPAHCTDYFSVNSRRQRMQLISKALRPFTAEPQHSRRSDFLRNRTPKRRTQPLSNSANISPASTATTTANISHEEEKEEDAETEIATSGEASLEAEARRTSNEVHLKTTPPLTRSHSRPRHERYCQALQPSFLLPSSPKPDILVPSEPPLSPSPDGSEWNAPIKLPSEASTTPPRKNRRRPVTLGSLDDFAVCDDAASTSSTPPSNLSLTRTNNNRQGWLWLKKRTSTSFGNRYVKRWCVFKQNTLYYYRNQEEESAEGLILLHGFTISPVATEGGRSCRYPFRVYNEWTKFVFAAGSEGARTRWMNMLGLAAIGQSACLWTSPIGGFHPGYLPAPSVVATEEVKDVVGLSLLEPPKTHTSGSEISRRQPLTIHRCSSTLNVPSSSGLQQTPLNTSALSDHLDRCDSDNHQQDLHPLLSVSATCLVTDSTASSTDDEVEIDKKQQPYTKETDAEVETNAPPGNQPPCRLMRRAAMIRRRRVRRLTEGSISPTVFLTSPPMMEGPNPTSEWMSLFSDTMVMGSSLLEQQGQQNHQLHSSGTSSGGDEGERGSEGGSMLLLLDPHHLSPTCSLSSRSLESPEQASSS